MDNMPLELQAARLRLAKERWYLNGILWNLQPVESKGLGTLGVDRYLRLYYDPDVVKKWTAEELVGVMYHECGHILRQHPERGEGYNGVVFNIAGDAEINDDISSETNPPVSLPKGCIMPKTLGCPDNKLAEEYYEHLMKNAKKIKMMACPTCGGTGTVKAPPQKGAGGKQPQAGQGQQGQPQSGQGQGQSQDQGGHGDGDGHGHGKDGTVPCPDCAGSGIKGVGPGDILIPMPGSGNCGSIADGHQRPWEHDAPGGKDANGKDTPPGIAPSEVELIRRQVAKDIVEHSKTRGDMPAWLERWAKEKLTTKVDWRRQLQAAIKASLIDVAGMIDYSYRKPSRRAHALPNVILPSWRKPTPKVVCQIDTSGSMSDKMLAQALAEIQGIVKALGCNEGLKVFSVDAAMGPVKKVFRSDQVSLVGGGGTDMGVGIAAVEKMKPRPDVLIILTDCYTPWPKSKPPFDIIIGRLSDGDTPPYAKVINIKE